MTVGEGQNFYVLRRRKKTPSISSKPRTWSSNKLGVLLMTKACAKSVVNKLNIFIIVVELKLDNFSLDMDLFQKCKIVELMLCPFLHKLSI